jgi:predicted MPP superfamily phosphohydrolase
VPSANSCRCSGFIIDGNGGNMNNSTKKRVVGVAIIGMLAAILNALFLEKYFFEIKTFRIGKRPCRRQMKLLLLADLHFKKRLDRASKKLARKINVLAPDLILIAGDIIDEDGFYNPAREFFEQLEYAIPKVAIMGNHDHKNRVRMQTYKQLCQKNNCTLLINESKKFTIAGQSLWVTGVDDFIEGNASFARSVEKIGREENHVLLIHSPLQQEIILKDLKQLNSERPKERQLNIRYIFAGHNHGGQVCIFGFAPKMPEFAGRYLRGWYNDESPYLYLSKGFGTSTLPFRFGARSEVTVFYLCV